MRAARRSSPSICRAGSTATSGAVMGAAVKARETRHVLPPQARPCAAAGTAALRETCASPTSAFPSERARARSGRETSRTGRRSGRSAFPLPRLDGHKYARGHAVVVSGDVSPHRRGAACRARRVAGGGGARHAREPARRRLLVNAAASLAVMVRAGRRRATSLREFLRDRRLQCRGAGTRAAASGADMRATGAGRARRASAPSCSMPMR